MPHGEAWPECVSAAGVFSTLAVLRAGMVDEDLSRGEITRRLRAGEIDRTEAANLLQASTQVEDRDGLWARWGDQGLFDDPIDRDSWTRFTKTRVEEVETDG